MANVNIVHVLPPAGAPLPPMWQNGIKVGGFIKESPPGSDLLNTDLTQPFSLSRSAPAHAKLVTALENKAATLQLVAGDIPPHI